MALSLPEEALQHLYTHAHHEIPSGFFNKQFGPMFNLDPDHGVDEDNDPVHYSKGLQEINIEGLSKTVDQLIEKFEAGEEIEFPWIQGMKFGE